MEGLVTILEERLLAAQSRSAAFSQRAFAKRLGLSSGSLSEILRRRRSVSPKLAQRLASRLGLSPAERKRAGLARESLPPAESLLAAHTFSLIADWWHYAILNLTTTKGFRSDPAWISRRLGITPSRTREAIARLLELGLLEKGPGQILRRTKGRLNTGDHERDYAIRRSHLSDLGLAERALLDLPTEERDFSSSTFTVKPESLPKLRALIRHFHDELMDEAEALPGEEVYRLAIQLFPLTRKTGDH